MGNKKLGNFGNKNVSYEILNKEDESRNIIFNNSSYKGDKLNFLDVVGRDGELGYLFADKGNFNIDEEMRKDNKLKFETMYHYYGLDIEPAVENINFLLKSGGSDNNYTFFIKVSRCA